jgi:hypothetical protein
VLEIAERGRKLGAPFCRKAAVLLASSGDGAAKISQPEAPNIVQPHKRPSVVDGPSAMVWQKVAPEFLLLGEVP